MIIDDMMNPNWVQYVGRETDVVLQGTEIQDIQQDILETEQQYIGVIDIQGNIKGAVYREYLYYMKKCSTKIPYAQIFDRLSVGVVVIDRNSRICYVNQAYTKIIGVSMGKIVGRYMNIIEKNAALLKVLKTGQPVMSEKQYIESVDKFVSIQAFPLFHQQELTGACSLFTDITQVNQLTQEIVRITDVANEFNHQIQIRDYLKENKIIGESSNYQRCVNVAMMAAKTDVPVLIQGENGTGKEIISTMIQKNSLRAHAPFVKLNCGAIPDNLIESELFGYESGAFTGAKKGGNIGKFQLADGGTLFLDEIGELPLAMQVKLLRVLQEGEIEKIGGNRPIHVNVRIIAATNQDLKRMIEDGTFRMDLYYRLNVVEIKVPPLRERGNDILLMANTFLDEFNQKYNKQKRLTPLVYQMFLQYGWPGNVRELRNAVEGAVVLSIGDDISPEHFMHLPFNESEDNRHISNQDQAVSAIPGNMKDRVAEFEKKLIEVTLAEVDGDKEQALKILGISRRTFYRKLMEYKNID